MNSVTLLGGIYNPLELKGEGDRKYIRFSLGVASSARSKEDSTKYELVMQYFNCTAFGKTAERLFKHYEKGNRVFIIGRLQANEYEKEDGTKQKFVNIAVEKLDIIDTKKQIAENNLPKNMNDEPF